MKSIISSALTMFVLTLSSWNTMKTAYYDIPATDTIYIVKSTLPYGIGRIKENHFAYLDSGLTKNINFFNFCYPAKHEICRGFYMDVYNHPEFEISDSQTIIAYLKKSLTPYQITDSLQLYGRKFLKIHTIYLVEQKDNKLNGYKMRRGGYYRINTD